MCSDGQPGKGMTEAGCALMGVAPWPLGTAAINTVAHPPFRDRANSPIDGICCADT